MGTLAYKTIRFRGRFYVFPGPWDGSPDVFGEELVDQIPGDPQKYKGANIWPALLTGTTEWLQKLREFYAKADREIEEHLLTISFDALTEDSDLLELDVVHLPNALRPEAPFDLEWTYTLDLDQEIFSVCDAAHFKMDNFPKSVWIKALRYDEGGALTISTKTCPSGFMTCPALASQCFDAEERQKYKHAYDELTCSVVRANTRLDPDLKDRFYCQYFKGLAYTYFCEEYEANFANYSLTWTPEDFVFRELAFAMLSMASGQVCFESFDPAMNLDLSWERYDIKEIGYVRVNKGAGIGGSAILPKFATGAHRPGEQRGSAPTETTYWFEDVLVCLATGLDRREPCEAAIAKAVNFGVDQGATDFQAVIMDLLYCVLLDVRMENGKPIARHTRPLCLFPIRSEGHRSTHPTERPPRAKSNGDDRDDEHENGGSERRVEIEGELELEGANAGEIQGRGPNDPAGRDRDKNKGNANEANSDDFAPQALHQPGNPHGSPEEFSTCNPGFVALMNFVEVAVARRFRRRPTTQGVLPTEIYAHILEYVDERTHRACASVSWQFRSYCLRHFVINEAYSLDKVSCSPGMCARLSVVNRASGVMEYLYLSPSFEKSPLKSLGPPSWIPVVGSERPSIMSQVRIKYVRRT